MKYINYVLAAFGVLIGWLFFERGKRKTAEAINANVEVKEQVQQIEGKVLVNEAQLSVEEEKRKEINEKVHESVIDSDLLKYFNKK